MSFVDNDSLSLAGLDAPDFLQLDNSVSSSLTAHCHSSCTTTTCMGDSSRRIQKDLGPSHVVDVEKVRIDVHVRLSTPTSLPLRRIALPPRPVMAVTSSNLFHPCHRSLRSTFQSSGTFTPVHPPLSTSHPPSSLENPPSTAPRSAPLMVTMPARAPMSWRTLNPQRPCTSAPTHILPGQVQFDGISCHARTVLSRVLVGIPGQNQGVAPELLILPAVVLAFVSSDAISRAFTEFGGGHETFASLRNGCTSSRLLYERCTAGNLSSRDRPLLDHLDGRPHAYRELPQSLRLYRAGAYGHRSPPPYRTASNGGSRLKISSPTKSPPTTSRLRSRNTSKGVVGSRIACAVWSIVKATRPQPVDRSLPSAWKLSWGNTPMYHSGRERKLQGEENAAQAAL